MNSPIIIDNYVLSFYKEKDFEAFAAIFTDSELCRYMAGEAYETVEDTRGFFNFCKKISITEKTDMFTYGIFLEEV